MARRLTYIVASVEKAVAFEWLCDSIDRERFDLSFILLNPGRTELEDELQTRGIPSQRITYKGYGDLPRAFLKTLRILRRSRPHIVHAHMLPACLVGLTAAKLARVPMRVYTRHHSVFHHDYAPRWVSVDRLMNRLATHIVAISENVYEVLHGLEGVPESKLHVIHHGFRVEDFDDVDQADVEALRAKYELRKAFPVIGVIARYMELKGIRDIVAAAPAILEQYPDTVFVFANAQGSPAIQSVVRSLPQEHFREIAFESNLFALYRLLDVHVHAPIDKRVEAFGQTYVEALLAGVPSVFTISGVATEFIEDERNALVVPHRAPHEIASAVLRLLSSEPLRDRLSRQGRADAESGFHLDKMVGALEQLYRS